MDAGYYRFDAPETQGVAIAFQYVQPTPRGREVSYDDLA